MTTTFQAPKKRSDDGVPPAGDWPGQLVRIKEIGGVYQASWKFKVQGRSRALTHLLSREQLGDLLVDFGLAGQDVDLAQLDGRACTCMVRTFGGRRRARVVGVRTG